MKRVRPVVFLRGGWRDGKVQGKVMAKTTTTKPKSRKTTTKSETPAVAAVSTLTVTEAEIARRAFEVFCARGGQHGRALDDWLQAERELMTAANTNI